MARSRIDDSAPQSWSSTDDDLSSDDQLLTSFGGPGAPSYFAEPTQDDDIILVEHRKPLAQLAPSPKRRKVANGNRYKGWQNVQMSRVQSQVANSEAQYSEQIPASKENRQPVVGSTQRQPPGLSRAQPLEKLSFYIRGELERYWTHEQYRGSNGQSVQIIYCKTRKECEEAAGKFANDQIIGFDMEWKSRKVRKTVQDNLSLIQIAAEDKIALFHIALIPGNTASEVLAPSLRRIIESDRWTMCGVAIASADARRLRKWMKLEPRGLFELSYFHNLVEFVDKQPHRVEKRLISLATLTHRWLGRPLFKGAVRTSDWSKPLSKDQVRYAAADAYAGFRIFHAMEKKRLELSRPPPRPAHTELGLPLLSPEWIEERAARATEQPRPERKVRHEQTAEPPPEGDTSPANPSKPVFRIPELPDGVLQDCGISAGPRPGAHEEAESAAPHPSAPRVGADDRTARILGSALRALRRRTSARTRIAETALLSDAILAQIVQERPQTPAALATYPGATALATRAGIDLVDFITKRS